MISAMDWRYVNEGFDGGNSKQRYEFKRLSSTTDMGWLALLSLLQMIFLRATRLEPNWSTRHREEAMTLYKNCVGTWLALET